MSGYNGPTTTISSPGSSPIIARSGGNSSVRNNSNIVVGQPPMSGNNIPTNAYGQPGNFNSYLNKMYKENREYNKGLSDYEFDVNYNLFDKMFNKIYDMYFQNQNYYTQLANNAVQRQVEDMKKAGINPILAGRYGGAQVPVLNMPVVSNIPTLKYNNQNMPGYVNEELSLYEIMLNYYLKLMGFDTDIKTTSMNNAASKYVADLYNITNKDIATMQDETARYRVDAEVMMNDLNIENKLIMQQIDNDFKLSENEKDRMKDLFKNFTNNIYARLFSFTHNNPFDYQGYTSGKYN